MATHAPITGAPSRAPGEYHSDHKSADTHQRRDWVELEPYPSDELETVAGHIHRARHIADCIHDTYLGDLESHLEFPDEESRVLGERVAVLIDLCREAVANAGASVEVIFKTWCSIADTECHTSVDAAAAKLAEPTRDRSEFEGAVAEYQALRKVEDDHPYNSAAPADPNQDAIEADHSMLVTRTIAAFERVIAIPAPDQLAVIDKLDAILDFHAADSVLDGNIRTIAADLRRLSGEG
jgi:hypothetical protein